MTPEEHPDDLAQQAYSLLQHQRYAEALPTLTRLAELADRAHRPDLCARAWTWLGHTHLHRGALPEARAALRTARDIATALGDTAGLEAIAQLRQAVGARAMQAPAQSESDTLLGRACQALDNGNHAEGEALARSALEEGRAQSDHRTQVFSLLALARVPAHTEKAVLEAAEVADQSNDRNLITAVAHAARAAGVALAPRVF